MIQHGKILILINCYYKRIKLAGLETIIYRLIINLQFYLDFIHQKNIFIISDNFNIKFFSDGYCLLPIKDNEQIRQRNEFTFDFLNSYTN